MSSTNRGGTRSENDFYETPAWCVDRLLEINDFATEIPSEGRARLLEPSAGRGAIVRAAIEHGLGAPYEHESWTCVEKVPNEDLLELRAKGVSVHGWDFLKWANDPTGGQSLGFDLVMMNPPYSLAMEFIEASFRLSHLVVALLRLNFMGSIERQAFFKRRCPDVYVLPNRPSFGLNDAGEVASDSSEYAWFVFRDEVRRSGQILVLNKTAPSVLEAHRKRLREA